SVAILLSQTPVASAASGPDQVDLFDFAVYTADGISSHNSDYQGLTGSGGDISLDSFQVGLTVRAQRNPLLPLASQSATAQTIGVVSNGILAFTNGSVGRGQNPFTALGVQAHESRVMQSVNYSQSLSQIGAGPYLDAVGLTAQMRKLSASLA